MWVCVAAGPSDVFLQDLQVLVMYQNYCALIRLDKKVLLST